jgi:hypothetical protein
MQSCVAVTGIRQDHAVNVRRNLEIMKTIYYDSVTEKNKKNFHALLSQHVIDINEPLIELTHK